MLDLKNFAVIEATADRTFFGFLSLDLKGFTGIGHSKVWGITFHCKF